MEENRGPHAKAEGVGEDLSADSLDIYKYRKRPDRNSLFVHRANFRKSVDDDLQYDFVESEGKPKKARAYAILQEGRTEFTNSKLRYVLLIYTNSAWNLLIFSAVFFAYIFETWIYTFCEPGTGPFWVITLIICLNAIFACDVVVIVGLKFFKKWRRTLNLVEPDTAHVVLDIFLSIPYAFLYFADWRIYKFQVCAIAPLVAAVRVYRILQYFYNKSSQAGRDQWTTFLFQYLILFLLAVHSLTCVWFLFAYREFDIKKIRSSWSAGAINLSTESVFDWYYVCAYWSIMFMTTNALGDLYPITTAERITATIGVILGFLLTTIVFVGSLTSQFITISTRRSKYVSQLKKIKNHLKLINMNADTTKRIIRYYEDLWYQKSGVFKPKLMELLPFPLRMEICYDLNAVPLFSSLIFRKLPEPFLRRLSLAMAHQFYLPGDVVCNQTQTKTIMICITSGVLELLSDEDDESPMISFSKGTCLGEISLVYNIPSRCTVKAATYVECQVLHKKDFIKLMITYPDLVEQIRTEIEQRIDRSKQRKQTRLKQTPLDLNVYATKDLNKSSIKLLKDKLRSIQGKKGQFDTTYKDENLDTNCVDLYILSEHIKKKTKKFTCIDASLPWILEADCPLVIFWEFFMIFVVMYICIVYPYYIGFMRSFPDGILYYIEIAISAILLFNILMTSMTAVKTKKKYIRKFNKIISYRLNTMGFYMDLIANIPLEYLVSIHTYALYRDDHRNHLFYLCKGIKLLLVWRISSFFENMEKKLLLNTIVVKVCKYCVFICLLCYWCGVILYMESCFVKRCSENSWYTKVITMEYELPGISISKTSFPLITSLYFSTTLIMSVGYGDITPGDFCDMGLVAFLSLYGLLLIGYCVAEFSAVVTHSSRTKTAFLEVILTIDRFMVENKMHPAIKARIMAFYELQWQYNSGVELTGDNWLEKTVVPTELRKKVLHQARFKALTSIRFFQVKNKAFIHTLTENARDIILPPGEIVFYGGTVTRELYIVESGYCLVTSKELRESKRERVIGPGNHLGLLVLLYGVPAVSSVVTLTHCKLITVGHAAYTSALSLFPDMREHEDLLTQKELKRVEIEANSQNAEDYLKQHKKEEKITRITSIFQDFFNGSFINVYMEYKNKKESYFKSYRQYHILEYFAPYLLVPIVIKPDGIFLKTWAILRVATAFMLCLLIPINVSMAPMCKIFNIPVMVLECFCYVDLYLMLHVAFYGSKNQLISHPYLTAKNYLKRAFIIDFITCAPWYALWQAFIPKHDEGHTKEDHFISPHMFHCIIRMINITQIYKLYAAFWTESIGALKRAYLMSVVQFSLLMLFFLNLYTSLLITLSCRYVVASNAADLEVKISKLSLEGPYMQSIYHPGGNMICQLGSWIDEARIIRENHISPMKAVLLGYYWSASTFSGAGFGDITAQDTTHMILSICITIHGVLFFGYVYARIASLKAMADQMITKFQENVKHLELFLTREAIPIALRQSIIDYWKYQWKRTGGWSHQSILGKLHANLNEDAVLYMYEKTLQEIPLFEDVEYSFFRAFAKKLCELYFQKGYMVIRANEVISHMYIIYRGKVDIISECNEIEACMGPGGIFGNIRGATRYLTMSNIVSSRNIDLLRIDGPEFYALLKSYPAVLRKVKYSVDSAPKDYVLPTILAQKRMSVIQSSLPDSEHEEEEEEYGHDEDTRAQYEDQSEEDDDDVDIVSVTNLDSPEKSIAESHGSRSITSGGNAEYISAATILFMPHRWFRSSVVPDCKWMLFMEYTISVLSYIDFVLLVYQMAFQSIPYFFYVCVASDIIFIYKFFLDVHTGYMNRYGDYVLNPKKVRKLFFSKVLLRRRDFLANLPVSYLAFAHIHVNPRLQLIMFCYLRTPQLFRITYLFSYRTHRKINMGSANLFFKLLTIGLWASLLSHVNACFFFKLSCLTPDQCVSSNWMSKQELNLRAKYSQHDYFSIYITALWYMINLLTITGTGDVSSQNDFEVVETIIIIVIIKFCTGLLISEMSAMITAHSSSRIAYDYGINELRDGLRDMDLSEHQMNKMWDYVRELWNRQQGRQMPELVYELPFRLRCQVMQAVYGSHISDSVVFSRTDEDFRRMLSMWMKHCVFFPGNYIVQCGDADQCIYFIHRGEVEVLTVHPNLTESIYDILGPEDCFGLAQGLFVGVSHHFSFRAHTVVDIVYLRLEQWKYLLDFYPKSARMVQKKIQNVYLAI